MQACTALNLTASFALLGVISFAGCGGPKPDAKAPTEAASGGSSAGAKTDDTKGAADPSGDGAGGEEKKDTDQGDKPAEGGDAETRTTEVIQKIVQDNRKPVRECYEKARKQIPDLKGTMTIHFVLDPEGKVKEAVLNVEKSEVKSPDIVTCAVNVLKKLKFPPSSRGMETTINYPYTFNP